MSSSKARRRKANRKQDQPMINNLSAFNVLDRDALTRICEMHEDAFAQAFGLDRVTVPQSVPDDFYLFKDNGAKILAVAHLDTVGRHAERTTTYAETVDGPVVFSRALDDRLGAYIILDMLPKLGINVDVLLTTGEESGRSTAAFFETDKTYDWMIEFDRGGDDVVMYQYDNQAMRRLVRACGAFPGDGIFSDISYMDQVGCKGFNWGVGYQDYHGPRAHAFLNDTCEQVDRFQIFYCQNEGTHLPHDAAAEGYGMMGSRGRLTNAWLGDTTRGDHVRGGMGDPDAWDGYAEGLRWDDELECYVDSRGVPADESDPFHWDDTPAARNSLSIKTWLAEQQRRADDEADMMAEEEAERMAALEADIDARQTCAIEALAEYDKGA